jgi:hypothetical protein
MDWKKDWKITAAIAGAVLLIIAVLAFIVKVQHDTIERLKTIETSVVESKNIGNGIVRAQAAYVTQAELERLLKEQGLSIDAIKKDLKTLGADVQGVHTISVVTPGYKGSNLPTSNTTPNPNPPNPNQPITDPNGYLSNQQWFTLTEPFNGSEGNVVVPFGRVGFSAWQDKPWAVEISPRTYSSTTVLGQDENGRHYAYSRFQIDADGKTYVIPITNAKIVEEYPSPSFSFNPRLYLGIDGGVIVNPPIHAEVVPNIGLSLFSYGQTKVSPQWSFLTLGVGYATQQQAPVLILSPINYNVGKDLPLVDNLHVGPSVSVDTAGNFGLYLGVRVAL